MTIIGEPAPLVDVATPAHALAAARRGLDFLVRQQVTDPTSADHGRFPFTFDRAAGRAIRHTSNWTTGVGIEALLAGYQTFKDERYLAAATAAAEYLRSLQFVNPTQPRLHGVIREVTPQSKMAHPRDALTAAWALLDYATLTGDADARERATMYADWFIRVGMEKGYPYWTINFDQTPWEPLWTGSFHSGSAFFLYRMFQATGNDAYRKAMRDILDYYNTHHLAESGDITVIRERDTRASLDGHADGRYSNRGWETMHVYNDDFGALANLAAWKLDGNASYLQAAERFLRRMLQIQRPDGGFGPADKSIPSAGGAVLVELMAAHALGHKWATPQQLDRAAKYLLDIQITAPGKPDDGAFLGLTDKYVLDPNIANIRAGAYAILALLRYGGAVDGCYFFTD